MRGYLAKKHYGLEMRHKLMNRNLEGFIDTYADYRRHAMETLQVRLAYLCRKMIKRIRLEKEEMEKRKEEQLKQKALMEELIRLANIHISRKERKKQVKGMMEEAIQILY